MSILLDESKPEKKIIILPIEKQILAKIKNRLAKQEIIDTKHINFSVSHNEIIVKGSIPTEEQRKLLLEMLVKIDGIKKVNTEDLTVQHSQENSLTEKLKDLAEDVIENSGDIAETLQHEIDNIIG